MVEKLKAKWKKAARGGFFFLLYGVPRGIRTPVLTVKG